MRDLLLVVVGVVIGVGLGFVLFHSDVESAEVVAGDTGREEAARDGAEISTREEGAAKAHIIWPSRVPGGAAPSKAAAELEEARARLAELEARVAAEEEARLERQGEPQPMRDDLAPRFRQETVRTSVNAALRELGLEGEVTAVDCSEYPCLLTGELSGPFGREESEKLGATEAMASYSKDSRYGFGTSRGHGEGARHIFGVAVSPAPADDEDRDAIVKRLRFRFGEMQHEGD